MENIKKYEGMEKKECEGKLPDPIAQNVKFSLKSR